MKTSMNASTLEIASPTGKVKLAATPMGPGSPRTGVLLALGLVEEAALEHPGAILGRQLDVARREEEDLVGDPLHPALEGVREPAREVDQTLRQLRIGRLEVEDHGDAVLVAVGDLLGVVEAARQDQVDPGGAGALHRLEVAHAARFVARAQDARPLPHGLRIGPVVVVVLPRAAGRQAAHVRLLVSLGELFLGEIAVLVPVLFLGDAEVDEGTSPDVGESHGRRGWYRGRPTAPARLTGARVRRDDGAVAVSAQEARTEQAVAWLLRSREPA